MVKLELYRVFREVAEAGVKVLAEVGTTPVQEPAKAAEMVRLA